MLSEKRKSVLTLKTSLIRLPFLALALLFFACNKEKNPPKEAQRPVIETGPVIKVMSYNIHIGNPPSKSADFRDLNAIAQIIKVQKPDLVALQEVDVKTRRSGVTVDQAKELARLTGMNVFFTKAIDFDGGQFGDAVLSRFPIIDSIRYQLPVRADIGGETRSVAMVTVEHKGHKFQFASTHLDHLANENNRVLQAEELVKIIKGLKLPLIIAGDLNAAPNSNPLTILKQTLNWGCKGSCPLTFSAQNPKSTIDYILVNSIEKLAFKSYNVLNDSYASDHLPLIAEIELK